MYRSVETVFRHFVRSVPRRPTRRKLVPDRFSGSRKISVIYKVEDIANFQDVSIRQQLQTYYRSLTQYLSEKTMTSDKEEAMALVPPPDVVRGMKTLDKSLFTRTVPIPGLKVPAKHINAFAKTLKMDLLKMQRVKPVAELSKDDPLHSSHKLFLLNPKKFKTIDDFSAEDKNKLSDFGVSVEELSFFDLKVGYENWGVPEILRAVLPETSEGVSSYSIIGHIAHLNLKPEVLDFKHLIGEVILDKNSSVKTVVNKVNIIDNTYRNFQMELLAGEDNLVTRAKENGCVFEMDFSKVYWNSRLSTEHERVVKLLEAGDVLYDVFAGVGPFAIPAARRGVLVHANDLNPHSHAALNANVKLNKVKSGKLQAYNMDGREFINTVVKQDLKSRLLARAWVSGDKTVNSGSVENVGSSSVAEAVTADTQILATNEENSGEQVTKSVAEGRDSVTSSSESICHQAQLQETHQERTRQSSSPCAVGARDFKKLYITMNLPAMALEFLDAFCGLLSDFPRQLRSDANVAGSLPTVMCYCFEGKNDSVEGDVKSRAEKIMGHKLPVTARVRSVRNVAPNKEMMCLEFLLTPEILFAAKNRHIAGSVDTDFAGEDEPALKKQKAH